MMNKAEKIVTMVVAIGGGFAGLWGAYTAYDASKFKQPFEQRKQIVKSFTSQISSAEGRKDNKEVIRVSLLLEKYEEKWRAARHVAKLIEPFENLEIYSLDPIERKKLRQLLAIISDVKNDVLLPPKTLGADYLALGDYHRAVAQLKVASSHNDDMTANALQAAAYGYLANSAKDQAVKEGYQAAALARFDTTQQAASKKIGELYKLRGFIAANQVLKTLLDEKGVELTSASKGR